MRHVSTLVPTALVLGLLVACGSNGGPSTGSLSGQDIHEETGHRAVTIEAVDNTFEPKFSSVSTGTTVTFRNAGHNKHNVISVGDGFGSSKILDPGDTWKVTFRTGGDFRFYCSLHGTPTSGMDGGVRVVP
jgi:plastocyanin